MQGIPELSAAAGVLLLLAGCLWWLRRHGLARPGSRGSRTRVLQVVERAALSPHHSLHLVHLAGRGLLVGVSPSGCAVLESFAWDQVQPPAGIKTEDGR